MMRSSVHLSSLHRKANRQVGSITISFLAMLIPVLTMISMTLAISAQLMTANRAAQGAESASLACAFADKADSSMLQAYQDYYSSKFSGSYQFLPTNSKCKFSLSNRLSLPLPWFSDSDLTSNVVAAGGNLQARIEQSHSPIPTEVVLVLDISGSMAGNISSLKSILTDALRTIENDSEQANALGSVRISIVPFESGVSTTKPPWLSNVSSGVYCIDGLAYQNDTFSASLTVDNLATPHFRRAVRYALVDNWLSDCSPTSTLLPLTNRYSTVQNKINSLAVSGGTASYQGLIWGVRQLLPSWQQAWGVEVNTSAEVRKKLVLLTDGADNDYRFDELVNAGFCSKVIDQYDIEMNFIGYGVTAARIAQFQQCTNDPKKVFSAQNKTQLDHYFSEILAVTYSAKLLLGK
ncbi:Tad domain-containing protein [Vibrio sp. 99-8-1]|uniref:Tad domain-containing protein n=1 Tax=Vibrio sp. 99-8-1 TaxID=2607602 RepID=UPI0020A317EB|nr:Tad domain-containing protein [Vibrio sp. 99-8-1]